MPRKSSFPRPEIPDLTNQDRISAIIKDERETKNPSNLIRLAIRKKEYTGVSYLVVFAEGITVRGKKVSFRKPTENETEKACFSGNAVFYSFGGNPSPIIVVIGTSEEIGKELEGGKPVLPAVAFLSGK